MMEIFDYFSRAFLNKSIAPLFRSSSVIESFEDQLALIALDKIRRARNEDLGQMQVNRDPH